MKGRVELDEEIDALAAWMPQMLSETAEVSQLDAFAGRAGLIVDGAGPDDLAYVNGLLQPLELTLYISLR